MKYIPSRIRIFAISFSFFPFVTMTIQAQEAKALAPAAPLFNGKDLTGWVPAGCQSMSHQIRSQLAME